MKFLSIDYLAGKARHVLSNYWLSVLSALAGSILLIISTESVDFFGLKDDRIIKQAIIFFLGISFFASIRLFLIRLNRSKIYNISAYIFAAIVLFILSLAVVEDHEENIFLLLISAAAFHLLFSVSAFLMNKDENNFWELNKHFFLRILLTGVFSVVLYLGLLLAVVALRELFNVDFAFEVEADLAVIIFCFISVFIFFSGIPAKAGELDRVPDYPVLLKVFAQYILLPLVAIYFVILYAFYFKIIINWEIPDGFVSLMIMAYATVGTLALLLVYPVRLEERNRWIKRYYKGFFISIIPLLVLLWLAIQERVLQYGITIPRYLLTALGIWLGFISLYFAVIKNPRIKMIPLSLLIVAVLSMIGPWSAFNISENSQIARLENILKKENIIAIDSIKTIDSKELKDEIYRQIYFLEINYGIEGTIEELKESTNINKFIQADSLKTSDDLLAAFGIEADGAINPERRPEETPIAASVNFSYNLVISSQIQGYDYFLDYKSYDRDFKPATHKLDDYKIKIYPEGYYLVFELPGKSKAKVNLNEKFDLIKGNSISISKVEDATLDFENDDLKAKIIFKNINYYGTKYNLKMRVDAFIFLKIKDRADITINKK